MTVKNIAAHEPISAKPPKGVNNPINLVFSIPIRSFIESMYKLPEKRHIPPKKNKQMKKSPFIR